MSNTERHYKMLLVSTDEKFIKEVSSLLQDERYEYDASRSAADAREKLRRKSFDLVIVNSPLIDEPGEKLCLDAVRCNGTISAVFAASDAFEEINAKVSVHGVFVLRKPSSKIMVLQAISMMICARERLRTLEEKVGKAESKLDEIRVVNKAKCMLIEHEGLTEADAHRHIEKTSMDAGIPKKLVAQIIINNYLK